MKSEEEKGVASAPAPPSPQQQVNEQIRAQYLQNVNMGLALQVRQLKAGLLLASSAGEIVPQTALLLYNELIGCASMVEQIKDQQ